MKIVDIVNEADYTTSMDYLGSLGKSSPHRGDPVMSPDLGGGQGPGGGGSPKVWRRGETPPPGSSAQQQAQQFLQGKGFKQPTPQEKLSSAAQIQAKATGEPVVTLKPGGLASRMLDKVFPEPKTKIEPTLGVPTKTDIIRKEPTLDEEKKALDYEQYLQDPNVQKMLNLIGRAEGADYDTIVGGKKKITDFSKHPNVVGLRTAQGPSKAAGKYQITKSTYDRYAPKLGIRDFSPESQDKIALQILHDTGALKDVVKGKFKSAVEKAGGTWTSLPSSKIIQGRGPRSWDWVAKNLQDKGTDVLAAMVGAGQARAGELPISGQEKIPAPKVIPQMPDSTTKKITTTAAKQLPQVDLFGHIFPSLDINKAGGIAGVSTKPYTLPDGTAITDKRELDKIRSLQKTPGIRTQTGTVSKLPPADDLTPDQEREQERRMSKIGADWSKTRPEQPEPSIKPTLPVRQEFEREFAKQRAAQGAGGTFDWTNPATGKTSKFTTDYAVEPKAKVAESINTELNDILKLAGRLK